MIDNIKVMLSHVDVVKYISYCRLNTLIVGDNVARNLVYDCGCMDITVV